jgi:hypothetical protein
MTPSCAPVLPSVACRIVLIQRLSVRNDTKLCDSSVVARAFWGVVQFPLMFAPLRDTNVARLKQKSNCESDLITSILLCLQKYVFNQRNDGVLFYPEVLLNL